MGLDATVYRDDKECEQLCSARIGNSAGIGHLAGIIGSQVPAATLLLTKVLYSGTHSGDSIPKEDVPQLQIELATVSQKFSSNADIQEFVASFSPVIEVALRHQRPITF